MPPTSSIVGILTFSRSSVTVTTGERTRPKSVSGLRVRSVHLVKRGRHGGRHGHWPIRGQTPLDIARFVANAFVNHIAEAGDLVQLQDATAGYVTRARNYWGQRWLHGSRPQHLYSPSTVLLDNGSWLISRDEVAQMAGVSPDTVSGWTHGRRPTWGRLDRYPGGYDEREVWEFLRLRDQQTRSDRFPVPAGISAEAARGLQREVGTPLKAARTIANHLSRSIGAAVDLAVLRDSTAMWTTGMRERFGQHWLGVPSTTGAAGPARLSRTEVAQLAGVSADTVSGWAGTRPAAWGRLVRHADGRYDEQEVREFLAARSRHTGMKRTGG